MSMSLNSYLSSCTRELAPCRPVFFPFFLRWPREPSRGDGVATEVNVEAGLADAVLVGVGVAVVLVLVGTTVGARLAPGVIIGQVAVAIGVTDADAAGVGAAVEVGVGLGVVGRGDGLNDRDGVPLGAAVEVGVG
jgi:hypothetical protein